MTICININSSTVINAIISSIDEICEKVPDFKNHVVIAGSSVDQCTIGSLYVPGDIDIFVDSEFNKDHEFLTHLLVAHIHKRLDIGNKDATNDSKQVNQLKIDVTLLPAHVIGSFPSYTTLNYKYQRFIIGGELVQPFKQIPHIRFNPCSFLYFDGAKYINKLNSNPYSFYQLIDNCINVTRIVHLYSKLCNDSNMSEIEHMLFNQLIVKYPFLLSLSNELKLDSAPMFAGGIFRDMVRYPTKQINDFDIFVSSLADYEKAVSHCKSIGLEFIDHNLKTVKVNNTPHHKYIASFMSANEKLDIIFYENLTFAGVLKHFDFTFNALGIVLDNKQIRGFKYICPFPSTDIFLSKYMINRHSLMQHAVESSYLPRLLKRFTRFEQDGFNFNEDTIKIMHDLRLEVRRRAIEIVK